MNHTTFTAELGERICDRIAAGESILSICRDPEMPCRQTIWHWRLGRFGGTPEFAEQYAAANEIRAEGYFDEVIDLADEAAVGPTNEKINAARLQADSRKWVLARMSRSMYGERTGLDVGGQANAPPIKIEADLSALSDDELAKVREMARKVITTKVSE